MAPTKSAGRVSIRVLPDSSRFREDLKKTLERIEDSMKVNIQVNPVMDKSQLAEMKRQIESLAITIRPDLDLTVPQGDIERIKAQIEAMGPEVNVDLQINTAAAAVRMAQLTRDRVVRIWPTIMGNGLANVGRHLAAIAGMSYITREINRGFEFLRSIDTHAVNLSKQALALGGIIAMAGGAAQALFGLGDALIKIFGLLNVAPALISSLGIAAYALIVPLKNLKQELSALAPGFDRMHAAMNTAFWSEARQPILDMATNLMPTLTEKMIEASRAMGAFTGELARAFGEHVTPDRFALMFDRVVESMHTVRGAVDPLIQAFTTLGLHGTKYLNRLSLAIVNVTNSFNDWIQVNDQNGNLDKWTEQAIFNFKELGGLIKGIWNTFGGLNQAIKTAGGPTLADMHASMDRLARFMRSPAVQEALVHVFRGMNTAVKEIGEGFKSMGPGLSAMAPTIERVFGNIGVTLKTLLGYLGQIMEHPAVRDGLEKAFVGLRNAVMHLAPAIEPFSVMLGSLLKLLGTVIENVAALVATIVVEWGPAIQRLSDTFDTLAQPLREMLETIVRELTPAVRILIDEAIIPLLKWLRDNLIPAMGDFIRDSGPGFTAAARVIGDLIKEILPVLTEFTDFFTSADGEASAFRKTLDAINLFLNDPSTFVNKVFEMEWKWDWDASSAGRLADKLKKDADEEVERAFNEDRGPGSVGKFNKWATDFFGALAKQSMDSMNDWAIDVGKWWTELDVDFSWNESWLGQIVWGIGDGFASVGRAIAWAWEAIDWPDWSQVWTDFKADFDMGIQNIQGAWDMQWRIIGDKWAAWKEEFSWGETFTKMDEALGTNLGSFGMIIDEKMPSIKAGFKGYLDSMGVDFGQMGTTIKAAAEGDWAQVGASLMETWNGISAWGHETWGGFSTWFNQTMTDTTEWGKTKWSEASTSLSETWEGIRAAGTQKMDDLRSGMNNTWDGMVSKVKSGLNTMGIDTNNGFGGMVSSARQRMSEITNGTNTQWNTLMSATRTTIANMGNVIGSGFGVARDIVRQKVQEMKDGAVDKWNSLVSSARTWPSALARAILSGGSLNGSGQSLMQGFIDGMNSMFNSARSTARSLMAGIRSFFPNSPAKEGPFSGQGWTPYSGAAVVDGFAQGMASRMNAARSVTQQLAAGVSDDLKAVQADYVGEYEEADNNEQAGNVTVKVYNPVAEPTSRTIARASSMIKLGAKAA